jgi:hypothetical protein
MLLHRRSCPTEEQAMNSHTLSTPTLRDPRKWNSGDEPMTLAQRRELETLILEAGEDFDPDMDLTKADAALLIEELRRRLARGETGGTVED